MNNYSPSITSVNIITMIMTSLKNTCVNVFLMRDRIKRYIKSLTGGVNLAVTMNIKSENLQIPF